MKTLCLSAVSTGLDTQQKLSMYIKNKLLLPSVDRKFQEAFDWETSELIM